MKKWKSKKPIKIFTLVCIIITVVSATINFLLPLLSLYKFKIHLNAYNSIGIIGGADGPTSVFVAYNSSPYLLTIIFGILSILGVVYLFITRKS
ncbi:hypothetical protein [Herbinix luporum]|jgi:Na+-transporting methylmalonyl-CoA/oxaloacetate decarboxylase beta subunit|uniref:Putative membrane protein n=1 Tax=Herbinix luporum TaxID=1679721 RepID=A0A0K8J2H3_9FIRM|nr:hypothetical protein [Herbinix luporum]CUH91640.1 putative membrane protein [Herbinix luporum]